jgi:hypothetical protein
MKVLASDSKEGRMAVSAPICLQMIFVQMPLPFYINQYARCRHMIYK